MKLLSRVRLFAAPWTVAYQVPPSMGFSKLEYWSELQFPSPGDLPNPGIEARSPTLQADALLSEPPGKPVHSMVLGKYIIKCIHHYSIIHSSFTVQKISFVLHIHPSSPELQATTDFFFSVSSVLPFPKYYIVGIMQYAAFSDWLFHTVLHLRSFHGLIAHFFLALNNIPLSGCTTVYLSVSPTEGHLGCFQVLAIMNEVLLYVYAVCHKMVSWWHTYLFSSFHMF